jgi:hypothetical protein
MLMYNIGTVAWCKFDPEIQSQVCGVSITKRSASYYPVVVDFEMNSVGIDLAQFKSTQTLSLQVIKDSILLKRGVLIYLRHIGSLLQRMTDISAVDAKQLKEILFTDVQERVVLQISELKSVYQKSREAACSIDSVEACFNLEDLRATIEPNIDVAIWKSAFDQGNMIEYLKAISTIEKRLFYNYNTLVLLYVSTLAS